MSDRPLLYDGFCGAGGCAKGYQRAGFRVVGIDARAQPRYCGDDFIQMDMFEFFARVRAGEYPEPAAWHCSPPCQRYSATRSLHPNREYPDLIAPTRAALRFTGKPCVIENVVGAPLRAPILLCGTNFGLRVYRHRLFESSVFLMQPSHPKHVEPTLQRGWRTDWDGFVTATGGMNVPADQARDAMGIDWMTRDELSQAIPPAYTEFIGRQLLHAVAATAA